MSLLYRPNNNKHHIIGPNLFLVFNRIVQNLHSDRAASAAAQSARKRSQEGDGGRGPVPRVSLAQPGPGAPATFSHQQPPWPSAAPLLASSPHIGPQTFHPIPLAHSAVAAPPLAAPLGGYGPPPPLHHVPAPPLPLGGYGPPPQYYN